MGMAVGMPEVKGLPTPVGSAKNPLAETHEFKQACSVCYVKTGEELLSQSSFLCVSGGSVPSSFGLMCFYLFIYFLHPQGLACWITHFILKSISAKRMLCSAESDQTKRGSSFGPDQQKPNMLDLITFAKVTFIIVYIFLVAFAFILIILFFNKEQKLIL